MSTEPSTTELRDALLRTWRHNWPSMDTDGAVLDVDAAIEAIRDGDIVPDWSDDTDSLAGALAWGAMTSGDAHWLRTVDVRAMLTAAVAGMVEMAGRRAPRGMAWEDARDMAAADIELPDAPTLDAVDALVDDVARRLAEVWAR